MAKGLSTKEQLFVNAYIKTENGTKAAIAAGYAANSAGVAASRLLKKVNVREAISAKTAKVLAKDDVSAERVIRELAKLAFHDPRKFFDADGRIKPLTELDDDTAMSIAGIETMHKVVGDEADGCVVFTKIKLADKGTNLERLGRYLKLFTDKVEHSGKVTLEQLIASDAE